MSVTRALISRKTSVPLSGTARIPGDKSMSHRALMLGALAKGETVISGLLKGEDVLNTAEAMRHLGARIYDSDDGLWHVDGVGDKGLNEPDAILDMGNSGTAARLLIGLVAGTPFAATFMGDQSLIKRPMKRITDPLSEMGASFLGRSGGRLPMTVQGAGNPTPIHYELPVASAQVKSAILLAGLHAKGITTVIENKPTRDYTENMLRHFGVEIKTEQDDQGRYVISLEGGQRLTGCAVDIPSDPSSAAFPVVAALLHEGSELFLPNIGINKRRTGLYETLQEMGAKIAFKNKRTEAGETVADFTVRTAGLLHGVTVPEDRVPSMIDEFPILAVAASCAEGTTTMTGLAELRVKESDRLGLMAANLKACGVNLEEGEDSLIIHGTGTPPAGGAFIETALDHRIAMSFLVLGSVTETPLEIDDGSHINTSFPKFIDLMNGLGLDIADPAQDNILSLGP